MLNWTVEDRGKGPVLVRVNVEELPFKFEVLLRADAHHDSPHSVPNIERRHLDEALKRKAAIADFGDIFDLMQCSHDKRRSYGDLKPQFKKEDYIDLVVKDAEEFYRPYKDNWVLLGAGNHELSVLKNNNTNPTARLGASLGIPSRGITGNVIFRFQHGPYSQSKVLHFHHGFGGNAPASFGVLKVRQEAATHPDADILVYGHSHQEYRVPFPRRRISTHGVEWVDEQLHLQIPSYKTEGAWESLKGFTPKPVGAFWLVFEMFFDHRNRVIRYDAHRAF